jgi:hypothetical protein
MLIETAAASGAVLACRKGKFASLKRLRIHGWYLLIISALLQTLLSLDIIPAAFHYATILMTYLLLIVCILFNVRRFSMKFALVGTLLNFLVIAFNNGYMPVSFEGLRMAGYDVTLLTSPILDTFHSLINGATHLRFLADILPIPEPYFFPQMLSVGDLYLMIGIFLFFQDLKPRPREKQALSPDATEIPLHDSLLQTLKDVFKAKK